MPFILQKPTSSTSYMHLQTRGSSFPDLEINVVQLGDHDFRVEHGGISMNISIAVYQKVTSLLILTLKVNFLVNNFLSLMAFFFVLV